MQSVKVAVVGDPGTGKTSLISTACKGVFDGKPVPVLPPARLPPDYTPAHVPMVITDTSSRPEDQKVGHLCALKTPKAQIFGMIDLRLCELFSTQSKAACRNRRFHTCISTCSQMTRQSSTQWCWHAP